MQVFLNLSIKKWLCKTTNMILCNKNSKEVKIKDEKSRLRKVRKKETKMYR